MKDVLLQTTVKDQICANLTFEEVVQLREALSLTQLDCSIQFVDKHGKPVIFPGVNRVTINYYKIIKEYGLDDSLLFIANSFPGSDVRSTNHYTDFKLMNLLLDPEIVFNLTLGLLKLGADPNVRNEYNMNYVIIDATIRNQPQFIYLLLKFGANPDATNPGKTTSLMIAATRGYISIMELLLKGQNGIKANINLKDRGGKTALMYAVTYRNLESARLLIRYGANINETDHLGRTARDYAVEDRSHELIALLDQ